MIRTVNIVHPFYKARSGRWFEKRKTAFRHDIYVFENWNVQYLFLHLTNRVVPVFVQSNWNTGEHVVKTLRIFVNYKHVFFVSGMVFVLNILDFIKLTKHITWVLIFFKAFSFVARKHLSLKLSVIIVMHMNLKMILLTVTDLENVNFRKGKSLFANTTTWQKLFSLFFISLISIFLVMTS